MNRAISSGLALFAVASLVLAGAVPAGAGATPGVWAVGSFPRDPRPHFQQTLTERFDGASWSVVDSPNEQDTDNVLSGIDFVSASDGWAVGNVNVGRGTLIERWSGAAWEIATFPDVSGSDKHDRAPRRRGGRIERCVGGRPHAERERHPGRHADRALG
jgi:hypothetical protein